MKIERSEHSGAVALALAIFASISVASVVLLNCAGVFVDSHIAGLLAEVAVRVIFVVIFIFSAIATSRAIAKRKRFDAAYAAVGLLAVTFTLLWCGVLQKRVERWNFDSRFSRRVAVVELARQGNLQHQFAGPCDCFYADLPREYQDVSAGREVLVSRHPGGFSVTFFVHRAGLWSDDDYTAFVFRADDNPPRTGEEDTDRFFEIRPLRQHWFFVRHT